MALKYRFLKAVPPTSGAAFFLNKAFTLMEIMVVMVIVGILIAVGVPTYVSSVEREKTRTAENVLYAIAGAQQKYYEDNGTYCVGVGCGDTTANLSTRLRLVTFSATDPFANGAAAYNCTAAGNLYTCTAGDGINTVTLTVTAAGTTVACAGANCPT